MQIFILYVILKLISWVYAVYPMLVLMVIVDRILWT